MCFRLFRFRVQDRKRNLATGCRKAQLGIPPSVPCTDFEGCGQTDSPRRHMELRNDVFFDVHFVPTSGWCGEPWQYFSMCFFRWGSPHGF